MGAIRAPSKLTAAQKHQRPRTYRRPFKMPHRCKWSAPASAAAAEVTRTGSEKGGKGFGSVVKQRSKSKEVKQNKNARSSGPHAEPRVVIQEDFKYERFRCEAPDLVTSSSISCADHNARPPRSLHEAIKATSIQFEAEMHHFIVCVGDHFSNR